MNSCRVAALNAKRTRCDRFSFNAEGSKEATNLATSSFRSISVTRETRGTFCAADLNGRRKLQVELGLENNQLGVDVGSDRIILDMKDSDQLCELGCVVVRKE